MKNNKDFQERYLRWKNGENYWDIRGINLPKYDNANKLSIFKREDGSYYSSPTNEYAFTENVTPILKRDLSNEATWDYKGDSGKVYKTRYTNDMLKNAAMLSQPNSEFYTWTDLNGNKHRDPRIIGMSGADPAGLFALEMSLGNAAYKTLLEQPLKAVGESLTDLVARDFRFTKPGNWLANKLIANQLNKEVNNFTGNTVSAVTPFISPVDHSIGKMEYAKPWKNSWSGAKVRTNLATKYYYKDNPNYFFELVNDLEPGFHSVHFKTDRQRMSYGDKMRLFAKVADEVPQGHIISTYGSLTKGGIHGVSRFGKDFGFIKVGERNVTDKAGNPVKIPILLKPRNNHVQGDEAVQMFKQYGGQDIPKGSINGEQLRKYVAEARERYGLIGNTNITDEEIAQSLYKHVSELGKGTAALNKQGEPQLLFRGDTKPYTTLRTNHNIIGDQDTPDNVLGTMFLDRTGIGEGWGPDRYLYLARESGEVMAPYRTGIETELFDKLKPVFKRDYVVNFGGNGIVDDVNISYPYWNTNYRGTISGSKILSNAFTDNNVNLLNGFVVRTPNVRDISNEVYTVGMSRQPSLQEQFRWLIQHEGSPASATRDVNIAQNEAVVNKAFQENQGLLRSKAGTPYRDEHGDYDYLVVPDFNSKNVKHILPYDLRIPRDWNSPNIYRGFIPPIIISPILNKLANNN